MSYNTPANPPPGWYPDPAGSPGQRWWNGTTWSESTQPVPAPSPYGAAQPYTPMQSHAQPFASAQPYGAGQQYGGGQQSYYGQGLKAPLGTNPTTPHAWAIALWPLLNTFAGIALGGIATYSSSYNSGFYALFAIASWLIMVLVAYFDSRELRAREVPKPFGWGWAFLPLVYVIGRAVVVYSRTGRGLAPLFVYIGAWVVGVIVNAAVTYASLSMNELFF